MHGFRLRVNRRCGSEHGVPIHLRIAEVPAGGIDRQRTMTDPIPAHDLGHPETVVPCSKTNTEPETWLQAASPQGDSLRCVHLFGAGNAFSALVLVVESRAVFGEVVSSPGVPMQYYREGNFMAALTTTAVSPMSSENYVQNEDVMAVRSRISWGAIMAGSVLALALYFLLTLLGGAIGFSVSGVTSAQGLGIAAAVWAIVVTAVCLFTGGFVAAQFTTGENKKEAAIYGLMVWAVVFAMLLWLMASGVKAGFNAMVGVATTGATVANAADANPSQFDWETVARRAGYTQQQLDDMKGKVKDLPAQAKQASEDPATKARVEQTARDAGEAATKVTWYTFLGTLVSMIAAAAGGYVGSGPTFRLFAAPTSRILRA